MKQVSVLLDSVEKIRSFVDIIEKVKQMRI